MFTLLLFIAWHRRLARFRVPQDSEDATEYPDFCATESGGPRKNQELASISKIL